MKPRKLSRRSPAFPALILAGSFAGLIATAPVAHGAGQTWSGGSVTNGNWSTTGDWVGGAAPGATTGTTNTDVATFNAAIVNTWGNSAGNPVVIDSATQNLGGITFTGSAGNYFIGSTAGNSLLLTSGGIIQIESSLASTNATETINAPLIIQGTAGIYTIQNNSTSGTGAGAGTLILGGAISGGATGTTVLTLAGSNTNVNTISGAITKGSATAITITKSGAGKWDLTNSANVANLAGEVVGTLNLSNGTYTGTNTFTKLGNTGNAILTLSGSASLTGAGATNLTLAGSGSSGTLTLKDSSSMTLNGNLVLGSTNQGTATLNIQGSATLNVIGTLGVGNLGTNVRSKEDIQITGGTVSVTGALTVSNNGDANVGTGTLNITNATVTADSLGINMYRQKGANINATVGTGAILQATNGVTFAQGTNSTNLTTATLTISGGGLLKTTSITGVADQPNGKMVLALTNGTIRALSDSETFISGFTVAPTIGTSGITFDSNSHSITIPQAMQGTGGILTKIGLGTLTLSASTSSYTGTTSVSAGTLVAGANVPSGIPGAFGTATSAIVLGDGSTAVGSAPSLMIGGSFNVDRAVTVGSVAANGVAYNATIGGSNTTGTSTYTGNITLNTTANSYTVTLQAASGGVVEFKTGTWTTNNKVIVVGSSGNLGTVKISNALSTTGGVSVNYGTLLLGAANALSNTTPIAVAGGILDLATYSDSITTLALTSGTINSTGGGGNLTTTGVTVSNSNNAIGGGTTVSGNASLGSGAALALNGALTGSITVGNGTLTGSGTVSGTTGVTGGTVNGSGLDLTGVTTFNGTGNTLSGTATSTNGVTLATSAALAMNGILTGNLSAGNGMLTGSGTVSGTTDVTGGTVNGSGLILTGVTTFNSTGNTLSGTVTSTNGVTLATSAALALNGTLTGNLSAGNGMLTGSGTVSGTTGVTSGTVNGTGLVLTGVTTFNGTGNTLTGTVTSTNGVSLATSAVLALNGTLTGNLSAGDGTLTGSGTVSGTTGMTGGTVNGSGLTLTGVTTFNSSGNTLTGTVISTNGVTLATSADLALNGVLTGGISLGTGTLTGSGGSISGNATLNGGTINLTSGNFHGTLGVTGGNWNGAGSVTGAVNSSSGTFTIGSGANLTADGGLHVTGGSIAAADATSTITGNVSYSSGTSSNFGGVIAGIGKTVTMNSAGTTFTLTGANTYSGATNVNAGTLVINGNNGGATGSVTVADTATLGGSGTIGGTTTIQSGGTISPGNSPGTLTINNANLLWSGGGNYNWQVIDGTITPVAGTSHDTIKITGTGTLDLSALSSTNKFNINLWSLASTGENGNAINWELTQNHTWTLVSSANAITNPDGGFNANLFNINTGAINGTGGFSNEIGGSFSIAENGNTLQLVYSVVTLGNNSRLWVGNTAPTGSLQTTSTTQDFGRVLLGSTQSATVALNKSGTDAATTDATVVAAGTGISTTTSSRQFISDLNASGINATLNTASVGTRSGTITITNLATDSNGSSQGSNNGAATINISGTVVNQRSFSLAGDNSIALGRFLITGTPNGGTVISSTGLNAVTANATLGNFSSVNGLSLGTTDSKVFDGGVETQTAAYTVSGTATSAGTFNGTFNSTVEAELGSIAPVTVDVTGTAVNQRSFNVPTIALGRFLTGVTPTGTTAISSNGLHDVTANASLGEFNGTNTGGLTLSTVDPITFNGDVATQTANYSIGGSIGTAGALSGASFSSGVSAEFGTIPNVVVNVTGNALASRTVNNPVITALGNYHAGASVNITSNAFGYTYGAGGTGAHADTEDTTVLAYSGGADANGITLTGALTNVNTAATFTRTFAGTAAVGSSGGSFNLTVNPELSAATSVSAAYTIGVYSGKMVWGGGTGNYYTGSSWTDSVAGGVQIAPGLDAGFTGVDTATFNGTGGTVSLSGSNPSLNAIVFNNNGSYTLDQNSGGSLMLAGTTPSITATGTHIISAPITLAANSTFTSSGGTLTVSNAIGESGGARSLTFGDGSSGTLILSGTNSYTGLTDVRCGTLHLTGLLSSSTSLNLGDASNNSGKFILGGASLVNQTVAGLSTTGSGAGNVIVGGNASVSTLTVNLASGTNTYAGKLGGTGTNENNLGLIKSGGGTLILSGANSYTGATTITAGTLKLSGSGTLGGTGGSTTGSLSMTGGTLDLNNVGVNIQTGAFTASGTSTIQNIASNQTLTFAGGLAKAAAIEGTTTFGGNGGLTISSSVSGLAMSIGASTTSGTTDMSGLGTLTASFGTGGTITFANGANSGVNDTWKLAANNSITAGSLTISDQGTGGAVGVIQLGSVNNLNIGNIYLGRAKGNGTNTGTFNGTITVNFLNQNNGSYANIGTAGARTNLYLAMKDQTMNSGKAPRALFDLTTNASGSGNLLYLGALVVAGYADNSTNGTGSTPTGTFTFNSGTVDVNTVSIGQVTTAADAAMTGTSIGTVNWNGGTMKVNTSLIIGDKQGNTAYASNATFNVTAGALNVVGNTFRLGNNQGGAGTVTGSLNITGGTVTSSADITTSGTTVSSLKLDGASAMLDMGGGGVAHSIGASGATIGTLSWQSGTLKNVLEINNGSGLVKNSNGTGGGILTLSGTNSYTGGTTVSAGTIKIDAGSSLGSVNGALTVNTGGTLDVNGNDLGVGSITGTGGTIVNNASGTNKVLTIGNGDGTGGNYQGVIADHASGTGTIALTKTGSGTLTFSGTAANTYSGMTTVTQGELDLSKTATVDAIAGNVTIIGGTLKWLASNQIKDTSTIEMTAGALSLNGKTETITSFTNSGGTFTTGTGTLIGTGNTLTWSGGINTVNDGGSVQDAHIVISGGTNKVEGGSSGGVLQLNSGGSGLEMSNGSTLTLDSSDSVAGKLLLDGNVSSSGNSTVTIESGLSLANAGTIDLNNGTRTFTIADGSATTDMLVSARIINGGLTKSGTGTLVLTGSNGYTGATTINAGVLSITGSLAAGSTVTVNNTGKLSGAGTVGGNTTINVGAIHSPDAQASGSQQTFSNNLTYEAGSIFEWHLSTPAGDTENAGNQGSYGQVRADKTSAVSGSAVFRLVLGASNSFEDAFWTTNKTWTNIFMGTGAPTSLSALFGTTFEASGGLAADGTVAGKGQFAYDGSALTWTSGYTTVPEPTSALAGILLAAGLLRRRR